MCVILFVIGVLVVTDGARWQWWGLGFLFLGALCVVVAIGKERDAIGLERQAEVVALRTTGPCTFEREVSAAYGGPYEGITTSVYHYLHIGGRKLGFADNPYSRRGKPGSAMDWLPADILDDEKRDSERSRLSRRSGLEWATATCLQDTDPPTVWEVRSLAGEVVYRHPVLRRR